MSDNKETIRPLRAIREKCLDCCCDQKLEVRLCPCKDCPLYPFRLGHNPNRKGVKKKKDISEEEELDG